MKWGELRAVRWAQASIVFQGALHSLNPVQRIGEQIAEPILLHEQGVASARRTRRVGDLLEQVGLPAAPGQGLPAPAVRRPEAARDDRDGAGLPTPADHRRRADHRARRDGAGPGARPARRRWSRDLGVGMMIISHDLSVLAATCDRVAVMYAGRVVEEGPAERRVRPTRSTRTAEALAAAFPTIGDPRVALRARAACPATRRTRGDLPPGCPFHPRCPVALPTCCHRRRAAAARRRGRSAPPRACWSDGTHEHGEHGEPGSERAARRHGRAGPGGRRAWRSPSAAAARRPARAVDGVDLAVAAGRDRRARRRVRLRQDHAGPHAARAGAADARARSCTCGKPLGYGAQGAARPTGGGSSWSCRTRPARSTRGTPCTRRSPRACGSTGARRRARAGRRGAVARRAAPAGAVLPALPARAVRRPAPARRHRRSAGARARR